VVIHFTADRGDARLRLDQVLVRRVTQVSGMSGPARSDGLPMVSSR
jgi:hypothetical protein